MRVLVQMSPEASHLTHSFCSHISHSQMETPLDLAHPVSPVTKPSLSHRILWQVLHVLG